MSSRNPQDASHISLRELSITLRLEPDTIATALLFWRTAAGVWHLSSPVQRSGAARLTALMGYALGRTEHPVKVSFVSNVMGQRWIQISVAFQDGKSEIGQTTVPTPAVGDRAPLKVSNNGAWTVISVQLDL